MKTQTEELEKLFAAAYQAAAAAGATAGAPGGMPDMSGMGGQGPEAGASETKSQDKGKVVDADFEVVDKDK
jgi:molecular chaperone DnaK